MKAVAESLAGRCAVVELEPLSVREITSTVSAALAQSELAALIVWGGFPELWRGQDIPTDVYFGSYLATYLERDVRQIANVARSPILIRRGAAAQRLCH